MNYIGASREPRTREAPRVRLTPHVGKTVEAICFIVAEADRRGAQVTQYDILKALFLADKGHLNRFGRPITYDNYFAMRNGPVASLAYNLLRENLKTLRQHGIDRLPWKRCEAQPGSGRLCYFGARSECNDDLLSPSDMDALRDALSAVMSMTFGQIRRLTHADPAYIEAWKDGSRKSVPMSYGMLFDAPDYEMAKHVKEMSESI